MKFTAILLSALFMAVSANGQDRFGWRSNPRHSKLLKQIVHDPEYRAVAVPDAASVKGYMPPIRDQGDMGSCTAFAGAAAFESSWKRAHGRFTIMSPLDLYQQSLYHDGNWGQDMGSYTSTVLWVLKNSGVCTERLWPYDTSKLSTLPTAKAVANRQIHVSKLAYDVPNDDGGLAVMRCIAHLKRGVLAGGYVYNSIFEPKFDPVSKRTYIPMPSGRPVGGHEIVYVSYDKNLVINGIKGWVEFRNSWGQSYGDSGYCWMPMAYAFSTRYMEDFGCVQSTR